MIRLRHEAVRRWAVTIAVGVLGALTLSACGNGSEDDGEPEPDISSAADPQVDPSPSPSGPAEVPTGADEADPANRTETTDSAQEAPREAPPATPSQPAEPPPLGGQVIAIDPGHNGGNFDAPGRINEPVDAGGFTKPCNTTGTTTQDGYRESTFNLEVALRVRDLLEAAGATVHMTREDDDGVGPCVDVRGTFGQESGAHLLLSIHADGAPASAHGFHVIRPSGRPGTDLSIVGPSEQLAQQLRDALVATEMVTATYTGVDGIVARDDLATLNLATVPAVLLEAGNMRNPDEASRLRDPDWQHQLAEALVRGIMDFLDTSE